MSNTYRIHNYTIFNVKFTILGCVFLKKKYVDVQFFLVRFTIENLLRIKCLFFI